MPGGRRAGATTVPAVAEIPEHLLRRSKERRAALGLPGGSEGGGDAPAPAEGGTPAAPSSVPAPAPAGGGAVPATAPATAPPVPVEEPVHPSYIAAESIQRTKVPSWVMPVLVLLPFWGFLYLGAFGERQSEEVLDPLVLGEQVYKASGCSSCHGSAGEGGVGPALAGGESVLTFPEEADHEAWVKTGSGPARGQPYGDPDRAGGQRGPAKGIMPGNPNLSDEEIKAVVAYEREKL